MRARIAQAAEHRARLIAALALAVTLALTTFSSALTVLELHDHDCTGDDCAICMIVHAAERAVAHVSALPAASSIAPALAAACAFLLTFQLLLLAADTPVTQGVRLLI